MPRLETASAAHVFDGVVRDSIVLRDVAGLFSLLKIAKWKARERTKY
jgi:hypothetical protein